MNIQHLEVSAGEDRTLTVYARDASNNPADLTNKSIALYVGQGPWHPDRTAPLITYVGTATDAPNGVFTVPVLASDTRYRGGDYRYVARTTTSGGNVKTVSQGRFRIVPEMVTP